MIGGVSLGLILSFTGNATFSVNWIKPFGTIFINLLKLIAVPLVLTSLIKGVASLSDVSKLSSMGGKTMGIYVITTMVAVSIGLVIVNITAPGEGFSEETRIEFSQKFADAAASKTQEALKVKEQSPLQPIVDMFPSNIFDAITDNGNMLQVIVFAIMFGISIVMIDPKVAEPVKIFFDSLNEVVTQLVNLIMMAAPYGVFALIASLVVDFAGNDPTKAGELLVALGYYSITVLIGLAIIIFGFYPLLLKLFAKVGYSDFFKGIAPAQMMAFSTSSSAATLPVTMSCMENNFHVPKETTSFVLPLGATVNMDGTSLYQGVATVFIAQAYGIDLSFGQQAMIVLTATLASIGAAAVPGAGVVTLIIVLEQAGIPASGIALILAPDRLLDMCRTVVNITGDTVVCLIVDKGNKDKEKK
ncbi:MAG: dicarboxylate/amino acid:cation symporter [Flammeovirgaceae bacterium]